MFMANIASLTENNMLKIVHRPDTDMCTNGGPGLMIQKDQFELKTWWNDAFGRLVDTSQYRDICDNIEEDHGENNRVLFSRLSNLLCANIFKLFSHF